MMRLNRVVSGGWKGQPSACPYIIESAPRGATVPSLRESTGWRAGRRKLSGRNQHSGPGATQRPGWPPAQHKKAPDPHVWAEGTYQQVKSPGRVVKNDFLLRISMVWLQLRRSQQKNPQRI